MTFNKDEDDSILNVAFRCMLIFFVLFWRLVKGYFLVRQRKKDKNQLKPGCYSALLCCVNSTSPSYNEQRISCEGSPMIYNERKEMVEMGNLEIKVVRKDMCRNQINVSPSVVGIQKNRS